MPLRVRLQTVRGDLEPHLVPLPVCDFCGAPIAHVHDGVWLLAPDRYELGDTPVLFAHHDRTDDRGEPVFRCHTQYDARERAAGRETPGWLELGEFIARVVTGAPGARQGAAEALELHERDVWLLRWLVAGMPDEPLPGQPKPWQFERADAGLLAERLAASVARRTPNSATDDDVRYGQFGRDLRDTIDRSEPAPEDEPPF